MTDFTVTHTFEGTGRLTVDVDARYLERTPEGEPRILLTIQPRGEGGG